MFQFNFIRQVMCLRDGFYCLKGQNCRKRHETTKRKNKELIEPYDKFFTKYAWNVLFVSVQTISFIN